MSKHEVHSHERGSRSQRALLLALGLTTVFAIVEAIAGWWSNSLALLGDAGHMITDSLALGVGALAAWISRRPPSVRHSYGMKRAEAVGALLNIALMFAVVLYIVMEAVGRLTAPEPVNGVAVMLVAAFGLLVNVAAAWTLSGGHQTLNIRGAMLHVAGDLLGSVAALIAGLVIWMTAWYPIDAILSMVITILIVAASARLLRDVLHIVMEGVPRDVDLEKVGRAMANVSPVTHVHDLHIWALDTATYAISAHVVIEHMSDWATCRRELKKALAGDFGIVHVTLQPETGEAFARECAQGSCGQIFHSNNVDGQASTKPASL